MQTKSKTMALQRVAHPAPRHVANRIRRLVSVTLVPVTLLSVCAMLGHLSHAAKAQTNATESAATDTADRQSAPAEFEVTRVRGQVVWFAEALQAQLKIEAVPESTERVLALQTTDGQIFPLIEDLRGRAFRIDKRLREMQVELLVRKYQATPALQILRVYEIDKDGQKFQVDYWCDICSITM